MTNKQVARLNELELKQNRTPQEETLKVALVELDKLEKSNAEATVVEAAKKAVKDAEAALV